MDAYERITRNAAEVVTEEEIEAMADDPDGKRAYVGYEPSGVLHIGHMLTANKLIDLQEAGFEVTVLLADVHAYLNDKGSFEEIRHTAERMRDQFIAYGLDESNTQFVLGSDFQLDDDYTLDLHSLELETTLARAERAMAEITSGDSVKVSRAVYPLMQALDIPYLGVDLAVGGMEQRKVHMLARDVLPSIDREPPTSLHTPLIADLGTGRGKMSSSEGRHHLDGGLPRGYRVEGERRVLPADGRPRADRRRPVAGEPRSAGVRVPRVPAVRHRRRRAPRGVRRRLGVRQLRRLRGGAGVGRTPPRRREGALAEYPNRLIAPGREQLAE